MPRIARVSAANYPHHITQRGNNRENVFFTDKDREFYLKTLSKYCDLWNLDIWAYCLMENHVHILAVPKKEESLAKALGGTNLVYTQYFNRQYNRSGRLWQNRFFSAVIEEGPYLWAVARYIEKNPVKADIVEHAEDYFWSSAKTHILRVKDSVLSDQTWLEESEFNAYREFLTVNDKGIDKIIRKTTSTGRPLGNMEFVKDLEKTLERVIFPKRGGRPTQEKR